MVPPAPGLLSTITGWSSAVESLSANTRVSTSVGPPAGNGTIIFTGFCGHVCAGASGAKAHASRNAAIRIGIGEGLRSVEGRPNGSIGPPTVRALHGARDFRSGIRCVRHDLRRALGG